MLTLLPIWSSSLSRKSRLFYLSYDAATNVLKIGLQMKVNSVNSQPNSSFLCLCPSLKFQLQLAPNKAIQAFTLRGLAGQLAKQKNDQQPAEWNEVEGLKWITRKAIRIETCVQFIFCFELVFLFLFRVTNFNAVFAISNFGPLRFHSRRKECATSMTSNVGWYDQWKWKESKRNFDTQWKWCKTDVKVGNSERPSPPL